MRPWVTTVAGDADLPEAVELVVIGGGIIGSFAGEALCRSLSTRGSALNSAFAGLIFLVAVYMLIESAVTLLA